MSHAKPPHPHQTFLDGMRRIAQTVTVVSTDGPAGRAGATVSAMTSVSVDGEHPTLLVCLNARSHCATSVAANGVFAVNVLAPEAAAVSNAFAGRYVPGEDKFAGFAWVAGSTGAPILDQTAVAFECRVRSSEQIDSHNVVIGEVVDVHFGAAEGPLVYENRTYGTFAPLA